MGCFYIFSKQETKIRKLWVKTSSYLHYKKINKKKENKIEQKTTLVSIMTIIKIKGKTTTATTTKYLIHFHADHFQRK